MTTYDISPIFRSTVGFDRVARLMDAALQATGPGVGDVPYNIVKRGDDTYRIMVAVPGYTENDLSIEVAGQTVTISGHLGETEDGVEYLYRGIAERAFRRQFQLADHVKVVDARLINGVLTIDLERDVPDEMKPRKIEISTDVVETMTDKVKKLFSGITHAKAA